MTTRVKAYSVPGVLTPSLYLPLSVSPTSYASTASDATSISSVSNTVRTPSCPITGRLDSSASHCPEIPFVLISKWILRWCDVYLCGPPMELLGDGLFPCTTLHLEGL